MPDFLGRDPDIDIHIGDGERFVDLVREGVDCALRVGDPADSDLIVRKLADLNEVTCATPDYLVQYATPNSIDDLDGHRMVGFQSTAKNTILPLEFMQNGSLRPVSLPASVSVSGAETYVQCVLLGFGIGQMPRYAAVADLATGRLVELLSSQTLPLPMPVSAIYPRDRHLSLLVRVCIDWAAAAFREGR